MKFEIKENYNIDDLLKIIEMLRDKDTGCPWDKVQTHQTIRKNFIEEVYEAIDAIDVDDSDMMQEEFGDVLLQILLHCQFEKERQNFDFGKVVDTLSKKLIYRHPHIFQGYQNNTIEGVLNKWEELKQKEKGQQTTSETLNALPKIFPALMYAQKLQKRACKGNIENMDKNKAILKIQNILKDIIDAQQLQSDDKNEKTIGELLYNVVLLSNAINVDAEQALQVKNKGKLEYYKSKDKSVANIKKVW